MDCKLKAKILFEVSQIDRLIDNGKPLLDLCKLKSPDFIEMSAAALVLQSFYNGIENILILIFKHYDEELPSGHKWHMELLDKASTPVGNRKQIFPPEIRESLEEYMKFRHFVRHAYGFQLEWSRMEDLMTNITTIWQDIKEKLNAFSNI